jgi:type II secretory pathway pseudopilin PulG
MIEPLLPGEKPPERVHRSGQLKQCHSCGREVPADAWKCRYCSEPLDRPGKTIRAPKKTTPTCLLIVVVGLSVVLFIGIISAIAVPAVFEAKKATNEASAARRCGMVYIAQELYMNLHGTYTSIEELENAELLEKDLLWTRTRTGEGAVILKSRHGYKFKMLGTGGTESWAMSAVPVAPGTSGDRSFYVDNTGVIRNELCTSPDDPVADSTSPVLRRY